MSLDAAYADFTAGNLESAEKRLRSMADGGTDAAFLLARILIASERFAEAEAALIPLARDGTHLKAMRLLVSLQYQRTSFDACETSLERLIALMPAQVTAEEFQRLVKLKRRAGKTDDARAVMRQALQAYPRDVELVAAYADILDDRTEACAELERYLATLGDAPSAEAAYLLKRIVTYRGPLRRAQDGLPAFGVSWDDTYRWPDEEGLDRLRKVLFAVVSTPGPPASTIIDTAWASVAQKKWDLAQTLLDHVRGGNIRGTLADYAYFGQAFHERLSRIDDAALERGLAPVQHLLELKNRTGQTLFIASDLKYFHQFTAPFLRAVDALSLPLDVQVHLLDGPSEAWQGVVSALDGLSSIAVGLSAEDSRAIERGSDYARLYYHAVRFIRLYQEVKRTKRKTWILDADVRLLRDPRPVLGGLTGHDLALGSNPCAFEPNLKFMACCVGLAPSPRGLAFARQVAAYILHMKDKDLWGWGVDQTALFSVYAHMDASGDPPKTRFLDASAICMNIETSGAFQFPSGIHKYVS